MDARDNSRFDAHEAVHRFHDSETGLNALVAIHSTALGSAAGGCRLWQYPDEDAALTDALRLSRGMTYRNAIAGLPFGGGKAVILEQPHQRKTAELFQAFGRFVDPLNGRYVTAEDVDVATEDILHVSHSTHFVSGLPTSNGAAGGDPSPWAARGVYLSVKAAVRTKFGADSLLGLRVAVQGVGNVGYQLCRLLHGDGAAVTVADVNPKNIDRVQRYCPVRVVEDDILYAPDYVVNTGGIISVAREYLADGGEDRVSVEVNEIPNRLTEIVEISQRTARPTHEVADEMAKSIVAARNSWAGSVARCA